MEGPSNVAQAVTLLNRIREVTISNMGADTYAYD
jgi:hypothetical protein